jgi:hypothetical protein
MFPAQAYTIVSNYRINASKEEAREGRVLEVEEKL